MCQASITAEEWSRASLWLAALIPAGVAILCGVYIMVSRKQTKLRMNTLKREFVRRSQLDGQLNRIPKRKYHGVFHDFNNLFQVIMGCGELAQMDLDNESTTMDFLNQIIDSTEKARELVTHLTDFGYRNLTRLKRVDLDEFLTTQIPLLRHTVGEKNIIRFSPVDEGKVIYADIEHLKEMLQDLTDNARDAMPGGGEIVVRTRTIEHSDPENKKTHRKYVQLTVKDTGPGIPEKHIRRVFEPFFSYGKGPETVGLGLTIVSSIVEGHGGYIEVQSKKGEGTCFSIYFPIIPDLSTTPVDKPQA